MGCLIDSQSTISGSLPPEGAADRPKPSCYARLRARLVQMVRSDPGDRACKRLAKTLVKVIGFALACLLALPTLGLSVWLAGDFKAETQRRELERLKEVEWQYGRLCKQCALFARDKEHEVDALRKRVLAAELKMHNTSLRNLQLLREKRLLLEKS